MSWRIMTRHTSTYRYGAPVVASYNEARITPQANGGQNVLESSIAVTPMTSLYTYRDYFSTVVVAFDVPARRTTSWSSSRHLDGRDRVDPARSLGDRVGGPERPPPRGPLQEEYLTSRPPIRDGQR